MSVELEVAKTTKVREPSQDDALAELRPWCLGSLRPKLVHAGAASIVPPAATDALDQSLFVLRHDPPSEPPIVKDITGRFLDVEIVGGALALSASGGADDATQRQAEVRERGQTVMPFDLDRTTHVFRTTASGGVEQVLADDPADGESIRLVREHLRREQAKFRRGDYQDPMAIHGMAMPGIDELRRGAVAIDVDYRPLPAAAGSTPSSRITVPTQWTADGWQRIRKEKAWTHASTFSTRLGTSCGSPPIARRRSWMCLVYIPLRTRRTSKVSPIRAQQRQRRPWAVTSPSRGSS